MLINRSSQNKQYLIPDSLTHNAATITALIGSSSYQVALSGLTANTLYFLYLRIVSGTATLQFSSTIPSAYRTSFPEAILVGAFYSNGVTPVAFGSFVNIEGVPTTANEIPFTLSPAFSGGNGTATVTGTNTYTKSGANVFVALRATVTKGTAAGVLVLTNLPFTCSQYGKSEVHCGTGNTFTGLIGSSTIYASANPATTNVSYAQVLGTSQGINPITVSNMSVGAMDLINEFIYTTAFDGKQLKDL